MNFSGGQLKTLSNNIFFLVISHLGIALFRGSLVPKLVKYVSVVSLCVSQCQ